MGSSAPATVHATPAKILIPESAYLSAHKIPLAGELFWATTAEVRFPFPFVPDSIGMQGAFFVDAGSLWEPGAAGRAGRQ